MPQNPRAEYKLNLKSFAKFGACKKSLFRPISSPRFLGFQLGRLRQRGRQATYTRCFASVNGLEIINFLPASEFCKRLLF